jgi:hypothetical protein
MTVTVSSMFITVNDHAREAFVYPYRRHVFPLRGHGSVSDFDRTALYDETKSINDGAITIPDQSRLLAFEATPKMSGDPCKRAPCG